MVIIGRLHTPNSAHHHRLKTDGCYKKYAKAHCNGRFQHALACFLYQAMNSFIDELMVIIRRFLTE